MPATNNIFFRPPNGSAFTIVTHAQGTFAGLGEGALLDDQPRTAQTELRRRRRAQ